MYFFRVLQENFLLIRGELKVPVHYVNHKVGYKYIVVKKTREGKEKDKYVWERLMDHGVHVNRCLDIPEKNRKSGGKCMCLLPHSQRTTG